MRRRWAASRRNRRKQDNRNRVPFLGDIPLRIWACCIALPCGAWSGKHIRDSWSMHLSRVDSLPRIWAYCRRIRKGSEWELYRAFRQYTTPSRCRPSCCSRTSGSTSSYMYHYSSSLRPSDRLKPKKRIYYRQDIQ